MSDNDKAMETQAADQKQSYRPLILMALAVAAVTTLAAMNPEQTRNIALMLLGFGAVIFVHELGHFVAAKAVNIEVEAFSLGINPVIAGVKKVTGGLQFRLVPELVPGKGGLGALSFVIPWRGMKAGETEYRVGLIPFGGFVKMLGQEDIGPDEVTDNPRAFGNRPVWQRMIVISAGVFMNVVAAGIVFVGVFANGVDLPPAVVGDVIENSAAAKAGIEPGDRVLAVDGKENPSFVQLTLAGAFPGSDNRVAMTVEHRDGMVETVQVEPQMNERMGMMQLGIVQPATLELATIQEPELSARLERVGLRGGDEIVAVNGQKVTHAYELENSLRPAVGEMVSGTLTLTVERGEARERAIAAIPMRLTATGAMEYPGQVLTMEPRPRIAFVGPDGPAERAGVQEGDVVLRVNGLANPTIEELQETIGKHGGETVELEVRRGTGAEARTVALEVRPEAPSVGWRVWKKATPVIRVGLDYATDMAEVADTQKLGEDVEALALPRGSRIVAVNDEPVADYRELVSALLAARGQEVTLVYEPGEGQGREQLTATVPEGTDWLGLVYRLDLEGLPTLPLEPMLVPFKGETLGECLSLGADMTYTFIAQTYLTIKGLIVGKVKLKAAMGPVGILQASYTIASQRSLNYYLYFMAIISVCIAVFNFLPLPILDGGHVVLLVVEKLKGSPVSVRTQTIINYIGLVLIGGLFLMVTFNDIVRLATG